jgi:outer membrane protein W
MSQRTRMRRFAVWLALALALWLPLAGAAAESDDSDDDEQADVRDTDEAPAKSDAKQADEEEEGESKKSGGADWSITHHGLYLIGQGSYSFMTADSDLEDKARDAAELGSTNGHVEDSWGYGGRIGYRFLDWLAVEAQAKVLNSIKIKLHDQADGTDSRSKATFFTAMANAKGYLLTERFQPYVLGGAGYGYAVLDPSGGASKDRSSGFVAQFGVGADYYVTDNLGLMTEVSYVWPAGGVNDYDNVTISFGAMLRFYGEK